jgi:hypothetical protein
MNYHFAWITMGKVSLVNLVQSKLRYHFGRDTRPPDIDETAENLSRFCIKAATKLLRLFDDMTKSGNLVRFSFTDFQACSIATIIMILARVLDQDPAHETKVAFGMDCLHKMAVGNKAAMSGMKFVEALQSIANQAILKLGRDSSIAQVSDSSVGPVTGSDYQEWADWLSSADQPQKDMGDDTGLNIQGIAPDSGTALDSALRSEPLIPRPEAWSSQHPCSAQSSNWEPNGGETLLTQDCPVEPLYMFQMPCMSDISNFGPFQNCQTMLLGLTGLDVLDLPAFNSSLAE